ncbi:MAG: hypothetical protein ACOCVF_02885 [bacterium]
MEEISIKSYVKVLYEYKNEIKVVKGIIIKEEEFVRHIYGIYGLIEIGKKYIIQCKPLKEDEMYNQIYDKIKDIINNE